MSTFDTQGMVVGYKVNRPLNEHEQQHRFDLRKPASNTPHYELSLTKLNSTYVECVDKWYAMRGWVAMGSFLMICLGSAGVAFGAYVTVKDADMFFGVATLFWFAMLGFCVYLFTRDAFTYTHYPIRFNRKNRQVYVFRRDGTVLKAGWEDIYWTIHGHAVPTKEGFVIGHLMTDDKKTVKESFALSKVTTVDAAGVQDLKDHFEFFRRYMEEGPGPVLDALKPTPLIMLPGIDKARESWAFGWERLTLSMNGWPVLQTLFQVFIFPESLFRWFAMRTSKIPQWPQWVEDECAIDPDDPWVRDERHRA